MSRKIVIAAAFALSLLVSPLEAQDEDKKTPQDKPATEAKQPAKVEGPRSVYDQIGKLLKQKKNEEASRLMSERGMQEFVGSAVAEAIFMTDDEMMEGMNMDDVPDEYVEQMEVQLEASKKLKKILKEYKLNKVKFDQDLFMPGKENEMNDFTGKVYKAVNATGKKWEIVAAVRKITTSLSPGIFSSEYASEEIKGNVANVKIELVFPGEEDPNMEMMAAPVFIVFTKKEKGWVYEGIDLKKTSAAQEKFMEEMGMGGMEEIGIIDDPEFTGETVDGKEVSLKDYRGKVVLIDFWGTWCGPCIQALPELKKVHAALNKHGFDVIGIAADPADDLKAFLNKKPLPWKNVVDGEGDLSDQFGVSAYPTTLLIDKEGNHFASELHGQELIDTIIDELELDEATIKSVKEAMKKSSDSKPKAAPKADKSEEKPSDKDDGEEPQHGFAVADEDENGAVSLKELRGYLKTRVELKNKQVGRLFKKLDEDGDKKLSSEEFDNRQEMIVSMFPGKLGSGGGGESIADPGPNFVPFRGMDERLDDRAIFGAVYNRYDQLLKDKSLEWPEVDVKKVPKAVPFSQKPKYTGDKPDVSDLIKGTVIIASGGTQMLGTGGGVIISPDGLVVTNHHIATSFNTKMVALTSDGKMHRIVELLAADKEKDVALVRMEGSGFHHLPVAFTAPEPGDDIVMMHHSENRFYTYDRGYVQRNSKIGRNTRMEINAPYAPGGSGCGIYNTKHELVGLVCEIWIGDGPSLAEQKGYSDQEIDFSNIVVKHAVHLSAIQSLWSVSKADTAVAESSKGEKKKPAAKKEYRFLSKTFSAPVMLKAGDEPMTTSSQYSSPALFDVDNDGKVEMVLGSIMGDVTYCENTADSGAPVWDEPQPLLDHDGEEIKLQNW